LFVATAAVVTTIIIVVVIVEKNKSYKFDLKDKIIKFSTKEPRNQKKND
jgi:hypothetical protein